MNKYIFYAILAIACIFCLSNCSSSRKTKTMQHKIIDSVAVKTTSIIAKHNVDSQVIKAVDSIYSNSIIIEYDTAASWLVYDTPVSDYLDISSKEKGAGIPVKKKPAKFFYNIDGHTISSDHPAKSIAIKQDGTVNKIDVTNLVTRDSSAENATDSTRLQIDDKIKVKDQARRGANVFIWIILGTVFLFLLAVLWRIRRGPKKIEQALNFKYNEEPRGGGAGN